MQIGTWLICILLTRYSVGIQSGVQRCTSEALQPSQWRLIMMAWLLIDGKMQNKTGQHCTGGSVVLDMEEGVF